MNRILLLRYIAAVCFVAGAACFFLFAISTISYTPPKISIDSIKSQIAHIPLPRSYVILSGSMAPAIPVGSVVVTMPRLFYTPGDIIAYGGNGAKIATTHRISAVTPSEVIFGDDTFITRGDANKSADTVPVSQENIYGKVILTVPYVGYFVNFAKTPKGFLALIVIPATIVIYEELKSMKKELAKQLSGIRLMWRKRKGVHAADIDDTVIPTERHSYRNYALYAIVPVVAASLLGFTVVAKSYFADSEKAQANYLGAAASFASPTPTPTPTGVPTNLVDTLDLPSTPSALIDTSTESTESATP